MTYPPRQAPPIGWISNLEEDNLRVRSPVGLYTGTIDLESEMKFMCRIWRNRQRAIRRKLKEARVKEAVVLKRSTRDSAGVAAEVRAKETIRSSISVGIGTVEGFSWYWTALCWSDWEWSSLRCKSDTRVYMLINPADHRHVRVTVWCLAAPLVASCRVLVRSLDHHGHQLLNEPFRLNEHYNRQTNFNNKQFGIITTILPLLEC